MAKAQIGKRYQHYKGREYIVRAIGRHSETLEEYVVYEGQYSDAEFGEKPVWIRPRILFEETIRASGKVMERFTETT